MTFISLYSYFMIKRYNVSSYLPFVMIDFMTGFFLTYEVYGLSLFTFIFSIIYFILSNFLLYYILIDYIGKITSSKQLRARSNNEIDKGIKALENNDYNKAIESFSNAIKEHKKNYLGYMGMCNTLNKMDKKNLKKIHYYKKKCIKYAPKNLKESIKNKY